MNDNKKVKSISLKDRFKELNTYVKEEFILHLPYTVFGVLIGLSFVYLTAIMFTFNFGEEEYHLAHFIHVLFSAAAGSAIFRSYQDSIFKALPIVLFSSVGLCALSDAFIPYFGLWIFGSYAEVHICAMVHPFLVFMFALIGFSVGFLGIRFFKHCNRGFHLIHILISTVASTMYMLSFAGTLGAKDFLMLMVTLFFAISIPCLIGDVTLPLCFVKIREEYLHEKVHHTHH